MDHREDFIHEDLNCAFVHNDDGNPNGVLLDLCPNPECSVLVYDCSDSIFCPNCGGDGIPLSKVSYVTDTSG